VVFRHDEGIKGEAVGLAANPEDLPMLTRVTRFSRAPEFVLSLSFLAILAVYVAAGSAFA
jgi:hypothetical protein